MSTIKVSDKCGCKKKGAQSDAIPQCSKLDLLSIIKPTPGKVCISSKYNSSCCPFPDGVLQYPICSWFASPKYNYSCWRIRQRCCGVTCLYSDDKKHSCADNNPGARLGKKISTNTLHGVASVNDLRAWSMCCEDRRRYFLDQMLSLSKPVDEGNDEDSADQEFLESGANPVEARYESLLSRKDDEIERLKQQLLALGARPTPRAEGAAELGRSVPPKSQESSGSGSSQPASIPPAKSNPPRPNAEGAAELEKGAPAPSSSRESSGSQSSQPASLPRAKSTPSRPNAEGAAELEKGAPAPSSSRESSGSQSSQRASIPGAESNPTSPRPSSSSRKASTNKPPNKGSGEPEVLEDALWNGLFGIPEEDENPNNETSPETSHRNSPADDVLAQDTNPERSHRNSPADDVLAQETDPERPNRDSTAAGAEDVAPTDNKPDDPVKPSIQVEFSFAFDDGKGSQNQPDISKILKIDENGQVIEEVDPAEGVPYDDGDFEFEFELPEPPPPNPPPGRRNSLPPNNSYSDVMRKAADTIHQLHQTIHELNDKRRERERNGMGDSIQIDNYTGR